MANEAQIRCSLQVIKGNIFYRSSPAAYNATVSGIKGPVPGALTVSTEGTDINFDELDNPGLCYLRNIDDTNFVTVGIRDPDSDLFYPVLDLLPGEAYVVRLSRHLRDEYEGTGTGTGVRNNALCVRADTDPCNVVVEAFEL